MKNQILAIAIVLYTFGESFSQQIKSNNTRSNLHENLLTVNALTQSDFVDFNVSAFGSSRVNALPNGVFRTTGGPSGATGFYWDIDLINQTINQSDASSDANDIIHSNNLIQNSQDYLKKIDLGTGFQTTLINNSAIVNNTIDFVEGTDGIIYLARDNGNMEKFDGTTYESIGSLTAAEGDFVSVVQGFDGNIYYLSFGIDGVDWKHGVFKYEVATGVMIKVFDQNRPNEVYKDLFVDSQGNILLGSSSGINGHSLELATSSNTTNVIWNIPADEVGGSGLSGFAGNEDASTGEFSFAMVFNSFNNGTIKIIKQSTPPIISNPISNITITEDAVDVADIDLANLSDNTEDTKSISVLSPSGIINVSIVDNTLSISTIANQNGTTTVTLDVTNIDEQTTQTSFDVMVTAVNDAPTLSSTLVPSATEDIAYNYTIIGNDVDGDALIFTTSSLPSWLSFDGTDVISGTPTNDEVGEHTFTISIQDGTVTTDIDITLTVANVNDAPTLTSSTTASATEDIAYTYTIMANDIDGDALTFAVSNLPPWLSFDNTDKIIGTPTNDEVGEHTFIISIQDGTVSIGSDITLTVANVNDAPTLTSATTSSATEDEDYTYTIMANDVDGDALTFEVSSLPSWLSFDNTDKITGTPANDEVGEHTFTISIEDGTVTSDADVVLAVVNVNDAPEISTIANQEIDAGKQLEAVFFTASDVDNEITLADITATSSNQALVADSDIAIIALADNQYELQLEASSGESGVLSINVVVSDGELSTIASFELTVNLVLAISDTSTKPSLTLSPNPTKQLLYLDFASPSAYQYSIYSIEGQLMFQENVINNSNQAPIDVSTYPQGMYIMHLESSTGISTQRKFIKK